LGTSSSSGYKMKIILGYLFILGLAHGSIIEENNDRHKRAFSLFSVVSFDNMQCQTNMDTTTTMYGVCFTAEECTSKGGIASGNCASGFGVCCFFKKNEANTGDTITNNITYIQNNDFPSAYTTTSTTATFSYTFGSTSDICQVRLDFDTFSITQPSTAGACTTDTVTITTKTGLTKPNIPVLCGTLTGSHMYFETGMQNPGGSIALAFTTATGSRTWKIKVSYIECTSIMRAPNDCLQYLTGKTNRFKSFNGNSGKGMIQTQMYTVCIRRECGYCSMDVSESFVTTTSDPDPFNLHPQTADTALVGSSCTNTFVSIFTGLSDQNTDTKSDKFCGKRLGSKDGDTVSGTIRTDRFRIGVFAATATQPDSSGFDLTYTQVACTS